MGAALVVVVLALLPVVLWRPYVGAVLYTVLAYLRPQDLLPDGPEDHVRLSLLVLGAIAVGLAGGWVRNRERPLVGLPWYGFLAALVGAMYLSVREAIDPAVALDAWLHFLQMLAGVVMTVVLCGTPERLRGVLVAVALSLAAMAVVLLVVPHWEDGRLTGGAGKLGDSNDLALALDMALPLLLFLRRHEPRRGVALLLTLGIPPVLVATVLTYSRGGFLALAAVGLGWVFFSRGRMVRLLIAPILAAIFLALAPASYLARLTTIEHYGHDESALDRLSAWKVATRIVEAHPWTGAGPGNFLSVYDRYRVDFQKPHVAHNAFLQIAADSGLPSAVLFALIVLLAIVAAERGAWRVRRERRKLLARAGPTSPGAGDAPGTRERLTRLARIDDAGHAIAVSLLAFAVGAQFLSRDTFDLAWLLTGLAAALAWNARREIALGVRGAGARTIRRTVRIGSLHEGVPSPVLHAWRA